MGALRAWSLYLGLVVVGGALLAPWGYWLTQESAAYCAWLVPLAHNPFPRFVHRSLLVLAIAGLCPLLRHLKVRSWREAGLTSLTGQWGRLGAGLALGFGSLAVVGGIELGCGARGWAASLSGAEVLRHLVNAGGAAVAVALLEEVLFRGALYGTLRRELPWRVALVVSSLVYAWVHFFAPVTWVGPVGWTSGLAALGEMLRGFIQPASLFPTLLNLTLVGAMLALAYQRTGTLCFSMGLHGGWIFWLKSYGLLTQGLADQHTWWWGTGKLIDGWLALPALAAGGWVVSRLVPPRPAPAEVG